MEHHSNIVPWQLLSQRTGAKLKWFGITDDGRLDLSNIDEIITEKTKIVSFVLISNILGTHNPVEEIVRRAQQVGALVCIDASQAAPHLAVDVQALGADFVAFTGHKMLGPTGLGVPRRRRDDRNRLDALLDLCSRPAQVRGGHAPDRPGGRSRCRGRLSLGDRYGQDRRA
jgi:selenocysteine lyase/cysteine desulfurase